MICLVAARAHHVPFANPGFFQAIRLALTCDALGSARVLSLTTVWGLEYSV